MSMSPVTRDEHFARLNGYRHSKEYAEYARKVGIEIPPCLCGHPSLFGVRWQITEAIYREFLEILPPMRWRGGSFLMSEFTFGSITAKYTKEGDRYFCEFVDATSDRPRSVAGHGG